MHSLCKRTRQWKIPPYCHETLDGVGSYSEKPSPQFSHTKKRRNKRGEIYAEYMEKVFYSPDGGGRAQAAHINGGYPIFQGQGALSTLMQL